jgi:hypothetical protein
MPTGADPALLLATVLELQLERATKEIVARFQASADAMAAGTTAQVEAATGAGQAIITTAVPSAITRACTAHAK